MIDIFIILKRRWFLTVSMFGGCGGLERTDFKQFILGWMWWSWKNWFLTLSMLGKCGGPERTGL